MEHTLWGLQIPKAKFPENSLNPCFNGTYSMRWGGKLTISLRGLNPCFNGTYSMRLHFSFFCIVVVGLNPCFNGTYSMRAVNLTSPFGGNCLNPCFNGTYSMRRTAVCRWGVLHRVLILVLMEHTLWAAEVDYVNLAQGLNPCFNGTYSMRPRSKRGGNSPR